MFQFKDSFSTNGQAAVTESGIWNTHRSSLLCHGSCHFQIVLEVAVCCYLNSIFYFFLVFACALLNKFRCYSLKIKTAASSHHDINNRRQCLDYSRRHKASRIKTKKLSWHLKHCQCLEKLSIVVRILLWYSLNCCFREICLFYLLYLFLSALSNFAIIMQFYSLSPPSTLLQYA